MLNGSIIRLDARSLPAAEQVGGKALSLMRMIKHGLPVPPGFCVIAAAYGSHYQRAVAAPNSSGMAPGIEDRGHIRDRLLETDLDPGLRDELLAHYRELGARVVAVRSSATSEDAARYSFAGQYESILNIVSFEDLLAAVKRCWSSLSNERVFEYCRKNNIGRGSIRMAVIVQRQIEADFAGVAFTVDPTTGGRNRIVIEYGPGLGDNLVSGRVAPRRATVDRRGWKVIDHGPVEKTAIEPDAAFIRNIARQAARIERMFGNPLDIEWAVQAGNLFILQARPITAGARPVDPEDRQIWTNANVGEVLPDVATPLTWSMTMPLVNAIFDSFLSLIGAELGNIVLVKRIAGRAYFNLNTLVGILRSIPGFKRMDITSILGGAQGSLGDLGNLSIPDEDIPVIKFRFSRAFLNLPLRTVQLMFINLNSAMNDLNEHRRDLERFGRIDLPALTDERLIDLWCRVSRRVFSGIRQSAYIALGMRHYMNLDRLCRKWFGGWPGEYANQLMSGMGDMESAKAGLALFELSRTARSLPDVLDRIGSSMTWDEIRPLIARCSGGKIFLKAWRDFMSEYGHHTRNEIELMFPRWSESSDYVLGMIRVYLQYHPGSADPLDHYRKAVERRETLTAKLRARLKNPLKRLIFDYYLVRAQHGSVIRENMKNLAIRSWFIIRQIALELGSRMQSSHKIVQPDDIFFLNADEVEPVLKQSLCRDVRSLIKERRAEYERFQKMTPPKVIIGRFDPGDSSPGPVEAGRTVLQGLAVCPGVVRGKARVITDTRSRDTVLPGEILVAPFTDPGWTPYFMAAAAIVVDMGGLLSHGSIVAREYGLPAVVNVGPATRIIKTGQEIEVDGGEGTVRIFNENDRSAG